MGECFIKRRGSPLNIIMPSEFIFENVSNVNFNIGKSTNDKVFIDWGDGNTDIIDDEAFLVEEFSHNYSSQSTYLVKVWSSNPKCEIFLGGLDDFEDLENFYGSFVHNNDRLISVKTGDNVKRIGAMSFMEHTHIRSFWFSANIHTIMYHGTRGINTLERVVLESIIPPEVNDERFLNKDCGDGVYVIKNENLKIYVPDENVSDYQNATNWSNYSDRIFPMSSKESLFLKLVVSHPEGNMGYHYTPIIINHSGVIRLELNIQGMFSQSGILNVKLNNQVTEYDVFQSKSLLLEVKKEDLLTLSVIMTEIGSSYTLRLYNDESNNLIS